MTHRLIPTKVVLNRICVSKTELYRKIKAGEFPKPVPVGRQRVAFLEAEVDEWIANRLDDRDEGVGATERRERARKAVANGP